MTDTEESILILTQYFPPETGAAQTRWDELTKRWAEKTQVTVITSAPDYPKGELYDGYSNNWVRREKRGEVEVIYTKTIPSSSGNLPRRSLKFVWFMLLSFFVGVRYTSPTVVIGTSPQPLTGVSGWLLGRLHGARFVFEVRDLWPESVLAVSDFDNPLIIWVIKRVVTFLYHRADVLVVVSRAFIDPIAEYGVDCSKIVYHPNGINPEGYRVGDEPPSVAGLSKDEFTVSYIGTIGRAHGLSIVLEAAPRLDGVQFVLVGDGAERERLETEAKHMDNVQFEGQRPKSEIPQYLAASDASLVHLKPRAVFETVIPSKLLEAMAAGLPVLLGVKGEAERILTEADAGITIEPNNDRELIAAVERLRTDDVERRQYGKNGREFVTEEFHWEKIANAYLHDVTTPAS